MTAPKEAQSLKPCPHCGEKDHLYPAYRVAKDGALHSPYAVDCLGCGADFTPREGVDAIAAWNRRAPEPSNGWRDITSDGASLDEKALAATLERWASQDFSGVSLAGSCASWMANDVANAIRAALAKAEREGMNRAAEMVRDRGPATQDMTSTMICAALDEAADAILSNIEEA